jgi:hypothetical protein
MVLVRKSVVLLMIDSLGGSQWFCSRSHQRRHMMVVVFALVKMAILYYRCCQNTINLKKISEEEFATRKVNSNSTRNTTVALKYIRSVSSASTDVEQTNKIPNPRKGEIAKL